MKVLLPRDDWVLMIKPESDFEIDYLLRLTNVGQIDLTGRLEKNKEGLACIVVKRKSPDTPLTNQEEG